MKLITRITLLLFLTVSMVNLTSAQCKNWIGDAKKEEAENAHVNYRQFVKGKQHADMMAMAEEDFNTAFNFWKTAYELAPAADGGRPFHYRDGRAFYRVMHANETDAAKKAEYANRLLEFYDEELACYAEGAESFLYGRKGYDMFYLVGYSKDALEALGMAIDKGGNDTEYIVLAPMGELIKYLFQSEKINKAEAREYYDKAVAMADYNIENNETYKTYYESGKANLVSSVSEVEDEIFDCAYFKEELLPEFEEDPENMDVVRYVLNKLKTQGCEETDTDVVRIQAKYDALYAARAEEYEAEKRRLNPAYDAAKMIEEENYSGAVARYQEAIQDEADDEKKAQYYYQMATIQSGKLGQSGTARTNANKAASLNKGWGKPYILIGDIYGRMSRNCGDSWQQRLAILAAIDKYRYAKSIDAEVASDANKRISNYSSSLPLREEGFQRNVSPGDKVQVGCGIGETVTVRFQ
ncbi:hypothetical protein CEQ90_04320 [Lewinellaceae bacterium SD302]|nr:hypothetical protein CEQ90_04320 [Lewinellaceae bacterium SD302]